MVKRKKQRLLVPDLFSLSSGRLRVQSPLDCLYLVTFDTQSFPGLPTWRCKGQAAGTTHVTRYYVAIDKHLQLGLLVSSALAVLAD